MNVDEKKRFRKEMLAKRDAIQTEKRKEADQARNERIRTLDVYRNAEALLFYVSYRSEADTLELIKDALEEGRCVAVPKVVGQDMVFYRIRALSQLVEGYKGILEPDTTRAEVFINGCEEVLGGSGKESTEHAILFVPGCAFDETGGRMGYGGGFYDRFMERYPELLRVALAYEEQIVEAVPREPHDKGVNIIVTEKRSLQAKER